MAATTATARTNTEGSKAMTTNNKQRVDWKGKHTPAWAAVNAAGVTAVVATGGYLAHMPPAYGLAEGAVGAIAVTAAGLRQRLTGGNLAYRASAWLLAGGWTSWAIHLNPWSSWAPIGALCAGTILAWGANSAFAEYEVNEGERRRVRLLQRRREQIADEWVDRLARVTGITGCQVVGVQDWPGETGYTIEVHLPVGGKGTTWQDVQRGAEGLAADMRLPEGCGVEVVMGRNRGTVIIRVGLKDVMKETIPLPMDFTPTSINDLFPIGLHRDGSQTLVGMRFNCGLLTGQTDAGKTNELNVINSQLLRCVDVLVWHIDTTGAGISLPWLRSWALDGATDRPVIDWTANTPAEAVMMTDMAIEIIAARKTGYQDLMFQSNDDKVPVSHGVPEIIIVADEVAELPPKVQAGIDSIINTGRAAGVRVLNCALRATQDTISAAMKKQTRLRIGMRAMDPEEYSHLFAGYQMVDPADAPYAGSGFVAYEAITPRPFKGFRIEPEQIPLIAMQVADRRPSLDKLSSQVPSGKHYLTRWMRTLPQLYPNAKLSEAANAAMFGAPASPGNADALSLLKQPAAPGAVPATTAAAPATGGPADFSHLPGFNDKFPTYVAPVTQAGAEDQGEPVDQALNERFNEVLQVSDPSTWAAYFQRQEGIVADDSPMPALVAPEAQLPLPARDRGLVLLDQAGPAGIGATKLAELLQEEGHPTTRQTAQGWLTRWAAEGLVVRREGDRFPVYVHDHHANEDAA